MNDTERERWQRVERLLDEALEMPVDERDPWLRHACGDDDVLMREVKELLEAGERADDFLADAAIERAAHLVALAGTTASTSAAPAPTHVGPFRLLREIGRGGMGTVHLAEREAHFRQRVALKLIRPGLQLDRHLVARFLEERQVLADLAHPGIAQLLDGGVTSTGLPWFAMEYVEGDPIDRACDARRLSIEQRIEMFCAVCDAVDYAHRRRVVHRDLKPTNILVSDTGAPKLLDFGIAKLVATEHPDADATAPGERFLTPDYASPEQLRGDAASPASDVYSLGVLLYELLTGQRPHRVRHLPQHEAEQVVCERDADPPSRAVSQGDAVHGGSEPRSASLGERAQARGTTAGQLRERLRGTLDAIVLKALSRSPERRYQSAADLASDLRRYLGGAQVKAASRRLPSYRSAMMVGAGLVALTAAVTLVVRRPSNEPARTPVFAVGRVADHRADSTRGAEGGLSDLLATNLARVPGMSVVSAARLYELMGRAGTRTDAGAYASAARRAGASELIDGDIYAQPDGRLRFDLRSNDLATGNIRIALTVSGDDLFALVDSGTARLARERGTSAPNASIAAVTTRSETAYHFYEEGLRLYYRGDVTGARAVLDVAIAQDSAFAMAQYYRALTAARPGDDLAYMQRALRLADRASDRERLIIRAAWQLWTSDPALVPTAESLTVRYPQELGGPQLYATALVESGDFPGAIQRFRQVIAADSAGGSVGGRCPVCDARIGIVRAYLSMDSSEAAIREARAWSALEPGSASAWSVLAHTLIVRGRIQDARAAYLKAADLDPSRRASPDYYANYVLGPGDLAEADAALREMIRSGTPDWRIEAAWYLAISLRRQGRFAEAQEFAHLYRTERERNLPLGFGPQAMMEAQVLFERGRYRESAAVFDSLAKESARAFESPSRDARYHAWYLALSANPLAAAGDTLTLSRLVDTVRVVGARSLLARDRRLYHHLRGLLLVARGDDARAVDEFRQAVYSLSWGYTRTNYEWAAALLRLDRAREAVHVLQPALAFALEGSGLYLTRTELEALLAQAWDSAGSRDSALVHYRAALQAWQRPDASLQPRVAAVRQRIAALESAAQ